MAARRLHVNPAAGWVLAVALEMGRFRAFWCSFVNLRSKYPGFA
jgi:hypothetical protein